MADVERTVRKISTDEELASYLRGTMTAFLGPRVIGDADVAFVRERFDLDRTWAAFDGDVQCGSSRTFPSGLRLPGLASVPVSWLKDTGADPSRLNVHGGAIALGHPLGGSGAKLMTTLVHALHTRGKRYGLQTMCEGGGLANVTIVERL